MRAPRFCLPLAMLFLAAAPALTQAQISLENQLNQKGAAALADEVLERGDATRGARLFYQPHLACTQCHAAGDGRPSLGPDLAAMGADTKPEYIVTSVLNPAAEIRKGFEAVTIITREGKILTGIIAEERPSQIILRDLAQNGQSVTLASNEIDERKAIAGSIMPGGLVNQLASRQDFLDLARYLIEIARGGPDHARKLRPATISTEPVLPDYERNLDHAGLIRSWNQDSLRRGEAIYNRVCINCHGTKDQPGSLPTSLRFATGRFKNGSDPYRMYQTLTRGFGQMTPQAWMVPQQKYDVIHYIREVYLRKWNPTEYTRVNKAYLASLPRGSERGPEPKNVEPWREMNYGTSLAATYEVGDTGTNFAYKGIAIRLDAGSGGVAAGHAWALYEHDTMRLAACWTGTGFIDWNSIAFNGRHEIHPRLVGQIEVASSGGPGWANPITGQFDDPRLRGRDDKPYGPLPREWAHFVGRYDHGDRVILAYTIGDARILDSPSLEPNAGDEPVFARTLQIGRSSRDLVMRVAPAGTAVALVAGSGASLHQTDAETLLQIPASATPALLKLLLARRPQQDLDQLAGRSPAPASLEPLTRGGPARWADVLETKAVIGPDSGPFAVDVLTPPFENPWSCQMRLTGFDFFEEGETAAVCNWDGDVWRVEGVDHPERGLRWRRIASGLFQPLGLKIMGGRIFVACRDQIVILHDSNGDGETDFYENFNSDHQVTEHFHEFAMDLQSDAVGNLYYAKAARHGKTALVPQHGTLLRVSKDGSRTDILATGFRAPNGVCLNHDGTFFLTDQEGFWTPKNRINWVTEGGFYGNMWGYHDVTDASDSAMKPPLCWITNSFDRSPAQMLWVKSPSWGPLQGSLLSLSYGYGKVFIVPHEKVGDLMQGGLCALPIPQFPTGIIRGVFHPRNGHLYLCGMYSWAGNQQEPGGFFRVRATGKPMHVPIGLQARPGSIQLTFSDALDRASAVEASRYAVKVWSLRRTENYGSPHVDEHPLRVAGVQVGDDRRTVVLQMPELKPTWCMEIRYSLKAEDGRVVDGLIHNTIHRLEE